MLDDFSDMVLESVENNNGEEQEFDFNLIFSRLIQSSEITNGVRKLLSEVMGGKIE